MKQQLFNILYRLGVQHILRQYKIRNRLVTILCLHRISDDNCLSFPNITPDDFRKLLQYISRHYELTTIGAIPTAGNKKPLLVLSFDDGYLDFCDNALPLLKEFGFPCNLNVVTRCLDGGYQIWTQRLNNLLDNIVLKQQDCEVQLDHQKLLITGKDKRNVYAGGLDILRFLFTKDEVYTDEFLLKLENEMPFDTPGTSMMSWGNLQQAIATHDIELGSHSVSHYNMPTVHAASVWRDEIFLSKEKIEQGTGRKVDIFAFPNGNYSDEMLQVCREAGYKHVLGVGEKLVPLQQAGSFLLSRVLLAETDFAGNLLKTENFQNTIKGMIAGIKR